MNELFSTHKQVQRTDTTNAAGGVAYKPGDREELTQLAVTGCFNNTYYVTGAAQLERIVELAKKETPEYLAKLAIYARKHGRMKDTPAVLLAILSGNSATVPLGKVFHQVIDNGKMLRNYVKVMRSGVTGRRSLGTRPKRLVQEWIRSAPPDQLFRNSVGNDPSLADVIKLAHPRPNSAQKEATVGYLIGKQHDIKALPTDILHYEAFKAGAVKDLPNAPFEMLAGLELTPSQWKDLCKKATWTQLRMNLNTFHRHDVFADGEMAAVVQARLKDPVEVRKSGVLPYQLMTAFMNTGDLPSIVRLGLQEAMEIACESAPKLEGNVFVFPDVSGSMRSPITGNRGSATTSTRCVDVAALIASAIVRKNPSAGILPFEQGVVPMRLNPLDSIATNAEKLAAVGGGGTDCSAPLAMLNGARAKVDLAIFVSDNESWIRQRPIYGYRVNHGTDVMTEWEKMRRNNPHAKLVCIDLTPSTGLQAPNGRPDILNVGGFSDTVFDVIANFASGKLSSLTDEVSAITI